MLSTACGGGGARASGSASVSVSVAIADDLRDPAILASCASTAANRDAELAIVSDLRDSYHEMIVCGGLALGWGFAVVGIIADAIKGKKAESPMIYKGNGVFASRNGMMEIQTVTASGAPLSFDVMDPRSYFAGFHITAGAQMSGAVDAAARGKPWEAVGKAAASAQIGFSGEGPGFALLGITLAEARSGKLNFKRIARALGDAIHVVSRIEVRDQKGNTTIHYQLQGKPQRLNDWLDGKKVPMTLASIEATNSVTQQTIRITEWTMDYRGDGGRVLDGTIGFEVEGGAFAYGVKFTYPHRAEPDVKLACRATELPAAAMK